MNILLSIIGVIGIIAVGLFATNTVSLDDLNIGIPSSEQDDFYVAPPDDSENEGDNNNSGQEQGGNNNPTTQNPNTNNPVINQPPTQANNDAFVAQFRQTMELKFRTEVGQPIEGYEPAMFMQIYPGLTKQDFHGVKALIGKYVYLNGELVHDLEGETMIHSAAPAIAEEGYETLLNNILSRSTFVSGGVTVNAVLQSISSGLPTTGGPGPVACTMEAKICPDGSAVGREGPDCEFAACPAPETVVCSDESKENNICTKEYRPVCGLVEVQCVTTPCNPVEETFSNGCSACAQGNVVSYTEGSCTQ
ncbi:hypothetical protein N9L18_00740 [Candidatus Pacebacteria bacterium]|nr:hypothetical protein [Candidatus Paceibacterota bacterium]